MCLLTGSAYILQLSGLHLTFDRTPFKQFCALLLCDKDVSQSDEEILYLKELSIYNTTLAHEAVKLASVSIIVRGLYVDTSKCSTINGTGSISSGEGYLALSFQDAADCLHGTFLCQLDFVTVSGQPGKTKVSTISGDSGNCTLIEKVLTAKLDNLTLEKTVLEGNVTQLSGEKLDLQRNVTQLSGEKLDLQRNVTQLSGEKLVLQSRMENATQRIALLEALIPKYTCSKGMPTTLSRKEFLLWGRIPALCDTENDGGGWVIIQRRTKGDVNFFRGWADYKKGFGTPDSDFWIGLDVIHNLTTQVIRLEHVSGY
ncbi:hypothetical protein BsWGS_07571 [Bradybaena similaris]